MAARVARNGSGPAPGRLFSALVIAAALVAIYLPPPQQDAIRHGIRQTALRPFIAFNVAATRGRTRAEEFDALRAQMDSALDYLAAHRTLAEENRMLRELLALSESPGNRYISAAVTRSGTAGAESSFRLNVGADRGVAPFAAVVTDNGLVGQVVEVRRGYALGMDWSHPDFRAAAMTLDGSRHGLIEPVRGRFREQDRLILRGLASLADLEPGEEIVTSGRGGVYPRGVRIGWVLEPAGASAGWNRSYVIDPAVHPGEAPYAAVVLRRAEDLPADTAAAPDVVPPANATAEPDTTPLPDAAPPP